jgi:YggT family protein
MPPTRTAAERETSMPDGGFVVRLLYAGFTLYMILILLRWFGGWLELDTEFGRYRWISRLTDPLLKRLRRLLPSMGPIDFSPLAALVLAWFARELSIQLLLSTTPM